MKTSFILFANLLFLSVLIVPAIQQDVGYQLELEDTCFPR